MTEPHLLRLVLPHRPHVELEAGHAVETVGLEAGFSRDTLAEVRLAVVEACLNALEYGGGDVEIALLNRVVDLLGFPDEIGLVVASAVIWWVARVARRRIRKRSRVLAVCNSRLVK